MQAAEKFGQKLRELRAVYPYRVLIPPHVLHSGLF